MIRTIASLLLVPVCLLVAAAALALALPPLGFGTALAFAVAPFCLAVGVGHILKLISPIPRIELVLLDDDEGPGGEEDELPEGPPLARPVDRPRPQVN